MSTEKWHEMDRRLGAPRSRRTYGLQLFGVCDREHSSNLLLLRALDQDRQNVHASYPE